MYSFHKFGHQLLVGLTGITYLICITGQFYMAFSGPPVDSWMIAIYLVDYTMLTMLFIALAVAWGLLDTSRARPVGISANVNVAVIFVDLRSSTQWAIRIAEKDFHYVRTFIDGLREWCLNFAEASALGRPRLVKFLGDGYLFVWEIQDVSTVDSANAGARLSYALSTHYQAWVRKNKHVFFWGAPEGIGVGFDVGPALRLTFENGAEDYLGAPMSLAAKMQNLARPCGGVVIQAKAWGLLNGLRSKFPQHGVLKFGDAEVPIRMTEDVLP
jgi:class 3 adenylate cyclase